MNKGFHRRPMLCLVAVFVLVSPFAGPDAGICGNDLAEIQKIGVLRHLGVPYARFVTGSGDGLDVELIKRFAREIGVAYRYEPAAWDSVIGDLTGQQVRSDGGNASVAGTTPVKGDLIANGLTILSWRQTVVDYSVPTFATQVWIIAGADAAAHPIRPSGNLQLDIEATRQQTRDLRLLGKPGTCLDPDLYDLKTAGADIQLFGGGLNDLVPAVLKGEADLTLLDVPDALIALEKWPGQIKVIGPVSSVQYMGVAFAKSSPALREAFNRFFERLWRKGTYRRLVEQYYPGVLSCFPDFFDPDRRVRGTHAVSP